MRNKESMAFLEWDEILNAGNASGVFADLKHKLIFSLYTLVPPRRVRDNALLRFHHLTNGPTSALSRDWNWLVVDSGIAKQLLYNQFKTAKKYAPEKPQSFGLITWTTTQSFQAVQTN